MSTEQLATSPSRPISRVQAVTTVASRPAADQPAATTPLTFDQLGLTPELLRAVAHEGYTEPTPVQAPVDPDRPRRSRSSGRCSNGHWQDAAFVLPILQLLNGSRPAVKYIPAGKARRRGETGLPIRCLVLTPTRELALQIEECVRTYGAQRPIMSTTIYGGVGFQPQVRALKNGPRSSWPRPVDSSTMRSGHHRPLVRRDPRSRRADPDAGHGLHPRHPPHHGAAARNPPRTCCSRRPSPTTSAIWPAAFSMSPLSSRSHARTPRSSWSGRSSIRSIASASASCSVTSSRKAGSTARSSSTRTKHGANRLAEQLCDDGILATAIHGNKSQGQRVRALDDFKAGRARSLSPPRSPRAASNRRPAARRQLRAAMVAQDYVHRIGRTGRAGSRATPSPWYASTRTCL